jgi:hypothetical protein
VFGFEDSSAILSPASQNTLQDDTAKSNGTVGEESDDNEEETTTTATNSKPTETRAKRDTEEQENKEEKWSDVLFRKLETSFNLASDDEDVLYNVFLGEPGKTAREMGPDNVEKAIEE